MTMILKQKGLCDITIHRLKYHPEKIRSVFNDKFIKGQQAI